MVFHLVENTRFAVSSGIPELNKTTSKPLHRNSKIVAPVVLDVHMGLVHSEFIKANPLTDDGDGHEC